MQIIAITADGGLKDEASSIVERTIADLLRVVRDLLDIEVAFVGAFCKDERRFRPLTSSTGAALLNGSLTPFFTIGPKGSTSAQVVHVPVQYEDGIHYGTLYAFSPERGRAPDLQGVERLKIAAQSTARLLAQADGHDIAVGSAMALRSSLVNRM